MSSFITLEVKNIKRETDACVSIVFNIPEEKRATFDFKSGQYITIKAMINGAEVRRSYSICTAPHEKELAVAVKRIEGGLMSTFLNNDLKIGDQLEVSQPEGRFIVKPEAGSRREHYFVAGGSGVTPVLSMIKTLLEEEPQSTCYLYYGSRNRKDIIFYEALKSLENRHAGQLVVDHTLSQPLRERRGGIAGVLGIKYTPWKGEQGRIDVPKFINFLEKHPSKCSEQHYYLCGPGELISMCDGILEDRGVGDRFRHKEYFTPPASTGSGVLGVDSEMEVTLRGRDYKLEVLPEKTLLESMLDQGLQPPYSCTSGACSSCIARVIEGDVEMESNFSLDEDELRDGYILTCQSHAKSSRLKILFKEVGDLEHE